MLRQRSSNSTSSPGLGIMNELMRRGGVLTLLRGRGRHFKRKSTPQPTTPTARTRPGRYPKLQPRSQSLGSLSVITDSRSPARYEPITNHPLRLTASVHYLGEEIMLFSTPPPPLPALSGLRRTHCSQLCLGQDNEKLTLSPTCPVPQPPLVPNLMPHAVAVVTNTNNNHIYADLELTSKQTEDATVQSADADAGSIASAMDEVVTCQQVHIEVNCSTGPDAAQSSIDAHLDRIDELNRALDDRLKRSLQPNGLNVIESAEETDTRRERSEQDVDSQDKRNSSNSSECRSSQLSTTTNKDVGVQTKKRSLSFTQKSISNLLTNIKEFSKSPLTRVVKNVSLSEEPEAAKLPQAGESQAPHNNNNNQQQQNESIATTSIATSTSTTTSTTTPSKESNSRLKFKVPKIQKKSKAIRNTFRTRLLNFQLRHSKTLCKQCTKRRRIHPSKSSFDLAKEFDGESQLQQDEEQQFCMCPTPVPAKSKTVQISRFSDGPMLDNDQDDEDDGDNSSSDDVLSIKDHCYCVPSLAASVSSSREPESRSADQDQDRHEIEAREHPATASK